jgi:hypothetical protein
MWASSTCPGTTVSPRIKPLRRWLSSAQRASLFAFMLKGTMAIHKIKKLYLFIFTSILIPANKTPKSTFRVKILMLL